MIIQDFQKNTIRHKKNSEWFQRARNSEKPENDTKIKILNFQENYHTPSLTQGSEQSYKVTSCNEKCNFFILLLCISLLRIFPIGIIPIHKNGISLLVQFLDLLFCRRGMPKWHSYPVNALRHSYRWFLDSDPRSYISNEK